MPVNPVWRRMKLKDISDMQRSGTLDPGSHTAAVLGRLFVEFSIPRRELLDRARAQRAGGVFHIHHKSKARL